MLSGMVAAEDRDVNAKTSAGNAFLKNAMGDKPVSDTRRPWTPNIKKIAR